MQAGAKAIIVANQMPSHEHRLLFIFHSLFVEAEHAEVVCLWNEKATVISFICSSERRRQPMSEALFTGDVLSVSVAC